MATKGGASLGAATFTGAVHLQYTKHYVTSTDASSVKRVFSW